MTPKHPTILIVDDEPHNRKLLEALLRPEGYVTHSAASGEEALAMAEAEPPDLILLDIMMPGMDGFAVAKILKSRPATSNVPIIMVTAHIDRSARLAGLDAGAEEFLSKPVDRAELWLRVRNLLRLKAYNNFLVNHSAILEQQVAERTADLQRFRTAMDATADGIMLISRADMRIVEANATASTMLGYAHDAFLQIGPEMVESGTRADLEVLYDDLIGGRGANVFSEASLRRADGSGVLVEMHRQVQRFGSDWVVVTVFRDITERKNAEQRMHHLAHFDPLTALPNRALFYDTLEKTLPQAQLKGWQVALMFIDLDFFKNVNDTLGHGVGDDLLTRFAARLVQCVRLRDVLGRLGGDEFGVILVTEDGQQAAVQVAAKIREALRAPFELAGSSVTISASIGITMYPADAGDRDTLIRYADTAMYRAKQAGRDTYRFFTAEMNAEVLARLDLETALRKALENDEFMLVYQPKIQLESGRISGLEALLRWQRPGVGMVSPAAFIPVLEDTGLIVQVGRWVIDTACRQVAAWAGGPVGPMQVSVNVSGRQFLSGELELDVVRALDEHGIPPDLLELELTETSLMANTERTIATLASLKERGIHISIDDFGTGYSSLAYLRRFPIDKLKVDIAFIRYMTSNPDDAAIVLAIISMAHSLKLEVIAEGVETEAQLHFLARYKCDQVQGFYFARPLPVAEVEALMLAHTATPLRGAPNPERKTLLLVDDDPFILSSLQSVLLQDGYDILLATSAAEGFDHLARQEVQVILCDQSMPGMDGAEFLRRVRDLYPDSLRMVLSGAGDLANIMEAMNTGAIHRFYPKPWDSKVLRENVREAFRYHAALNDSAAPGQQ